MELEKEYLSEQINNKYLQKYQHAKIVYDEYRKKQKTRIVLFLLYSLIIFSFLTYIFYVMFYDSIPIGSYIVLGNTQPYINYFALIVSIVLSALISSFIFVLFYTLIKSKEGKLRRNKNEYELVMNIQEDIDDDIFTNSIKMSYKYLDQYYSQTREHAQQGFRITIAIAIFGAVLIAFGIILMFFKTVKPSYVTCAAGVLTEFISSIFFYLYNKTIISMRNYHNKLVLSQNVSIALKVAESLPEEDRVNSKKLIVSELLKNINTMLISKE